MVGREGSRGDTDCVRWFVCVVDERGIDDDTDEGDESGLCVGRSLVGNMSGDWERKAKARGAGGPVKGGLVSDLSRKTGGSVMDSGCCGEMSMETFNIESFGHTI